VPTYCTSRRRLSRAPARLLAVLVASAALPNAIAASVVPAPAASLARAGGFRLAASTSILVPRADVGARTAAHSLAQLLAGSTGLKLMVRSAGPESPAAAIVFKRRAGLPPEGYLLEVGSRGITIEASTGAGMLYAADTLWQLVPLDGDLRVAAVSIHDQPAYRWRGLMLDSARHFQQPEFVKRLIDAMALLKLNVLHWHLTDDQGWRLQIRRYPKLTSIGAFRVPAGRAAHAAIDPSTHAPRLYGGYYSQATVRAIVAYAAQRHVLIVPEIDMPGHASAAIAAYPELGTAPVGAVPADWGIYDHVFNMSEATCQFLERVLGEVIELFPGPYVHIGGDEVQTREWAQSPEATARAATLGLSDVAELRHYLIDRMARFLSAHGRRLVGWDEIIGPGLDRDAVVMSWHGPDDVLAAVRRGNDTVLSPWPTLYFDFLQSDADDEPPGRVKTVTLRDVYSFDPRPPGLTPRDAIHLMGVQANLWTEHMRTEERVWHAAFPRAAALAELGWTAASRRDFPDFVARLDGLLPRWRRLGVAYADSAFAVRLRRGAAAAAPGRVELYTETGNGEIHYTLDGTLPTPASPEYRDAIEISAHAQLRANSFAAGEPLATPRRYALEAPIAQRRSSRELELCSASLPLALEIDSAAAGERPVVQLDIMNPCWIWRAVDLSTPQALEAAVGPVPFNYQIGADAQKIRVGDARSKIGELEVRLDGCEGEPLVSLPLAEAAPLGVSMLRAPLPVNSGVHDLCLRFARPALDPMWAIDWVAIEE
jgi:hexosaminidase